MNVSPVSRQRPIPSTVRVVRERLDRALTEDPGLRFALELQLETARRDIRVADARTPVR